LQARSLQDQLFVTSSFDCLHSQPLACGCLQSASSKAKQSADIHTDIDFLATGLGAIWNYPLSIITLAVGVHPIQLVQVVGGAEVFSTSK